MMKLAVASITLMFIGILGAFSALGYHFANEVWPNLGMLGRLSAVSFGLLMIGLFGAAVAAGPLRPYPKPPIGLSPDLPEFKVSRGEVK
jgi:hypothetical protein